ncbi:MAG: TetR family transcriptional regulator [Caldithrix sp.]|nr:TetR family transcriptional regulator [Caldithrix sp.]
MSKGETTREHIIAQAAALFNSRGFAGAPLSELMKITGLQKGGIYNHFNNKEEILIAAFRYSVKVLLQKVQNVTAHEKTPRGMLKAIIEFYRDYPLNPVIKGGCPILNAMVDSDNTNPVLRKHVQAAIEELIRRLQVIVAAAIHKGEFKKDVDAREAAIIIFTTIEGGVALSRNYEDNHFMETMIDFLHQYVDQTLSR